MSYHILLVAHIAVLGYWIGSELCINSEYRFICFRNDLDFAARDAMTDHLMDIDQHVRYALILQLTLGSMLAATLGYLGETSAWIPAIFGAAWVALVEVAHRSRKSALGNRLAMIDRGIRYAIAALLVAIALGVLPDLPLWLRWKLGFFAALIGCGVWIRFLLMRHFRVWSEMREAGSNEAGETVVRRTYIQATSVLALLWLNIAAIVTLAIWKPF